MDARNEFELIGIGYSPWTEKARWALDCSGLPYRYREHTILIGMPALRLKLGEFQSELTLPILVNGRARGGTRHFMDSFEIARFSDSAVQGTLFPRELVPEIKHFNLLSETILEATRALVMNRVLNDPEAQKESLPKYIPGFVRPALSSMARMGLRYLDREFKVTSRPVQAHFSALLQGVLALKSAVVKKTSEGRDFLLGPFTYADICSAVALQGVMPVGDEYINLTPALRRAWTSGDIADRFPELIEWRDRLYSQKRKVVD